MKKKLLIIAAVFCSSLAFTACEEEIIQPNGDMENIGSNGGDGSEKEDEGQFD